LGVASGEIADFRAEIQRNLTAGLNQAIRTRLKRQIFSLLLEQNAVEIPKVMIERESARLHSQSHQQGGGDACHHSPKDLEALSKTAGDNVLLGLVLSAVVKKHELTVRPERLQSHLQELSASYENPSEVVRWYNDNPRAMDEIRMQLLEDEIVDKLLEGVTVTEKSLSYADILDKAS